MTGCITAAIIIKQVRILIAIEEANRPVYQPVFIKASEVIVLRLRRELDRPNLEPAF